MTSGRTGREGKSRGVLRRKWPVLLAGVFLLMGTAGLYLRQVLSFDAPDEFSSQKGELLQPKVTAVEGDTLFAAFQLTLTSSEGYRVQGHLRVPRRPGPWPVLVLLGGVETGRMAAELITPESPHVILGLDYPWDGPTRLTPWQFLTRVLAIRRAMLLTPSAVSLAIDYLETRPDVDPSRIILVGASFGAQLVAVPGAIDPRAGPVALIYGGGDYARLLAANLKVRPHWLRSILARAGARLLEPVEPLRYVSHISPDPVIVVNGLKDDRIPHRSVMLLYEAALEPKRLVWLEEGHISSRDRALLKRVLDAATVALAEVERERYAGGSVAGAPSRPGR